MVTRMPSAILAFALLLIAPAHRTTALDPPLATAADGQYLASFARGEYQGIASDHYVEFDIPDAFLPEFPPGIFIQNRPELGDVSRGEVVSIMYAVLRHNSRAISIFMRHSAMMS